MTGDGARDGSNPKALEGEGDWSNDGDLPRLEAEMSPLLDAMGAFAREEEAEIGTYAANTSHALSEGAREGAVRKILALQARERAERTAASAQDLPPAGAPIVLVRDVPPKSPWTRTRRPLLALGSVFVAAALALALWMHPAPQDPSLPPYSIAARGGIKDSRGVDAPDDGREVQVSTPEQRLDADSLLVVAARPETAVTGTVAARAFLVQGEDITEIAANAQVAPTGAIELHFRGAELIGARHGTASLRVIVGRPAALQALPARADSPTTDGRWRVLTVPLDLGPR